MTEIHDYLLCMKKHLIMVYNTVTIFSLKFVLFPCIIHVEVVSDETLNCDLFFGIKSSRRILVDEINLLLNLLRKDYRMCCMRCIIFINLNNRYIHFISRILKSFTMELLAP